MIFYLRDTEETVFFSFEVMTSLSAFVTRVNHIINNSSATTSSILKNFHGSEFYVLRPFRMLKFAPNRENVRIKADWYVGVGVALCTGGSLITMAKPV